MPICDVIAPQRIGIATHPAIDAGLLFCGALGFLCFFIVFLFLKTRDRIYFFYFLFIFFSLAGAIFNLKRGINFDPSFLKAGYFMGAALELVTLLAFAAYCLFTIRLLEIKSQNKRLFHWINIMAAGGAIYGILYCFIRPDLAESRRLLFIFSRLIILFMSIIAILWVIRKIKSPVKNYFIVGSCWYFLGALFAILRDITTAIPFPVFYYLNSNTYFQSGIFLEVLSFTLALSHRMYIFYERKNLDQARISTLAISEKEMAQAEVLALRVQISPHFLFNFLNVIKYYIQINQNKKAIHYLVKFSQFIRKTLDSNQNPTISLEQELNITAHYLSLEKIRFNENFSYSIKIDKEIDIGHHFIPPMLLQPFVEEAVWNGTQTNSPANSEITVAIRQSEAVITISIEGKDKGGRKGEDFSTGNFYKKVNRQITAERVALFNKKNKEKISYRIATAEELKKENKNSKIIIKLLFTLFLCILFTNAFSQGKNLKQLKSAIENTKDDSSRVIQMIHFTRELHRLAHQEDKEYKTARVAVDIALKSKDTLLYARALDNLGLLYRYHEWYAQAIPLHIKAYKLISQKKVPPLFKMIFANNTGLAARYNQQYDLSIEYYLKALKIATNENNLKNIAISNNGLGNALSNIPGKEEDALDHFIRALNAEKKQGDSLGMAMDLLSISDYYIHNEDYTHALRYLDTLYTINKLREDHFGLAITNQFYGKAYSKENKYNKKAEEYYLKSLHQFKKLNNVTKEAELLSELGLLYQETGSQKRALHYYLTSLQMADSIRNKELISKNAYAISSIKEAQNNYSEALRYYQKAKSYEDSIALSRQKIKVAALTNQYQLDQKESKINTLQSENLTREKQIVAQKEKILSHQKYFIVLLAIILFILLFLFFQYRNRKAKRLAERLLQKNNEALLKAQYEKSIAQAEMLAARTRLNPHFLFNSLTAIHLLLQKGQTKKAAQYLIILSRFFRRILELPKSNVISLEEEVELISYYISLEKKRFGEDFHFKLQALNDKEMKRIQIPPLLLQPFVENAIWHGLLPSDKPEKILSISLTKQEATIIIEIEDNGVGRRDHKSIHATNDSKGRKSLGMKITRERIDQFNRSYNYRIALNIVDQKDESGQRLGTKVVLTIEDHTELITNLS